MFSVTHRHHDHVLKVLVHLPLLALELILGEVGVGPSEAVGGRSEFLLFLLFDEKSILEKVTLPSC